jgi:hypothetical protein
MPPRAAKVWRAVTGLVLVVGRNAGERQGRAAALFNSTIASRHRFSARALRARFNISF